MGMPETSCQQRRPRTLFFSTVKISESEELHVDVILHLQRQEHHGLCSASLTENHGRCREEGLRMKSQFMLPKAISIESIEKEFADKVTAHTTKHLGGQLPTVLKSID